MTSVPLPSSNQRLNENERLYQAIERFNHLKEENRKLLIINKTVKNQNQKLLEALNALENKEGDSSNEMRTLQNRLRENEETLNGLGIGKNPLSGGKHRGSKKPRRSYRKRAKSQKRKTNFFV
jgi:SMC interacting uncharacterized protein involved in chromosome segregation